MIDIVYDIENNAKPLLILQPKSANRYYASKLRNMLQIT
jgi:hypothetical protein